MEHKVIAETRKVLEGQCGSIQVTVDGRCVVKSDNFIAAAMRATKTEGVKVVDVFVQPEDGLGLTEMARALGAGIGEFLREHARPGRLDQALSATVASFVQGLYEGSMRRGVN